MRLGATGLQDPGEPPGIRLAIDRAVGISGGAAPSRHRRAGTRPCRRGAHERAANLSAQVALQKYRVAAPLPRLIAFWRGM